MNWIPLAGLTEWPEGTPTWVILGRYHFNVWQFEVSRSESLWKAQARGYTHYAIVTGPDEVERLRYTLIGILDEVRGAGCGWQELDEKCDKAREMLGEE